MATASQVSHTQLPRELVGGLVTDLGPMDGLFSHCCYPKKVYGENGVSLYYVYLFLIYCFKFNILSQDM